MSKRKVEVPLDFLESIDTILTNVVYLGLDDQSLEKLKAITYEARRIYFKEVGRA